MSAPYLRNIISISHLGKLVLLYAMIQCCCKIFRSPNVLLRMRRNNTTNALQGLQVCFTAVS